jgi:DNA-binding transcriptional LysR family regulator
LEKHKYAMKDLDLTSLRHFVAVCETGSITRAAEQEHIVTSAISKRLAQLEETLGVTLFERSRRGVAPTPAGETLLEHARAILGTTWRIVQDMEAYGAGVRGKVHLLGTVSAIAESLPDDVAAFMKLPAHREIQVDIQEAVSREIVRRIAEGSASVGVLWDATDLQGLHSSPYRMDNLAVVAHADHPLSGRRRCSFEDTLDYEHVGLEATSAVNVMLARAAAIAGKRMRYRVLVSNFEASLRVVRANLGLSIIPRELALPHSDAFGLKVIELTNPWARRRFVICRRPGEPLPKAAALLVDYLEKAARG